MIVSDAQGRVALCTQSLLTNIEKRLPENLELTAVQWLATDKISNDLALDWKEVRLYRDTLAFLQYTSGSTL